MTPTPGRTTSSPRSLRLLLVGDAGEVRDRVASLLEEAGHGPVTAVTPAECEAALEPAPSAAVLLALPRDTARPLAHLPELVALSRRVDPGLPIVVVGDGLSAADTAAAYRAGAVDVLFPDKDDEELGRLGGLVERRAARAAGSLLPDRPGVPRILGAHPGMQELARLVERVAPAEATVLVLGESGTGKELVARALHVLSPRRKAPFVAINCAAIPDTLLENELFGHEKGAYTGASATAMGKVEAAEKGTLFLDEIGEMPLPLQSKILRLLQEKTYDRIGGTRTRKADIRIVAATNRDLKEQVAAKDFREDLYYRLSVVPLTLPALRDRPSDIPLLAQRVLERIAGQLGRPGLHFSADAMERMVSYRWPGNVRELENEIERAAVLAHGDEIGPRDLELRSRVADPDRAALARLAPLEGPLEASVERAAAVAARIRIAAALEESGGDRARAAENLGISLDELNERA